MPANDHFVCPPIIPTVADAPVVVGYRWRYLNQPSLWHISASPPQWSSSGDLEFQPLYVNSAPPTPLTFTPAQPTVDLVTRQPDIADGERYTNIDIAKRMWETYNVCGDRWFKYAAQRLQALADQPPVAPCFDELRAFCRPLLGDVGSANDRAFEHLLTKLGGSGQSPAAPANKKTRCESCNLLEPCADPECPNSLSRSSAGNGGEK